MCQTIQTTISIIIRIDYYISSIAANLHTQELLQVSSAILNDVISHNETKPNSQKTSSEKCHFIQPCVCWWPDTVRYQGICRHSDDQTTHGFKTSESDKITFVHCQRNTLTEVCNDCPRVTRNFTGVIRNNCQYWNKPATFITTRKMIVNGELRPTNKPCENTPRYNHKICQIIVNCVPEVTRKPQIYPVYSKYWNVKRPRKATVRLFSITRLL